MHIKSIYVRGSFWIVGDIYHLRPNLASFQVERRWTTSLVSSKAMETVVGTKRDIGEVLEERTLSNGLSISMLQPPPVARMVKHESH